MTSVYFRSHNSSDFYRIIDDLEYIQLRDDSISRLCNPMTIREITEKSIPIDKSHYDKRFEKILKTFRAISNNTRYYRKGDSYFFIVNEETVEYIRYSKDAKARVRLTNAANFVLTVKTYRESTQKQFEFYLSRTRTLKWVTY